MTLAQLKEETIRLYLRDSPSGTAPFCRKSNLSGAGHYASHGIADQGFNLVSGLPYVTSDTLKAWTWLPLPSVSYLLPSTKNPSLPAERQSMSHFSWQV